MQRQSFFGSAPCGPGEGSKGQISFNYNYKVNFKYFYTKTLCVFSQMKDTKHIRRDFHSVAWVMPQGRDFGALVVPRGSFFFQTWSYGLSNRRGWRAEQNAGKFFILGSNWMTLGWGQRSNIINFRLLWQFQRVLYQILCVFSQMKDTKLIRKGFYSVIGVMTQGWDFVALGVPSGWNIFFFSNMVMSHIKSTGMRSRTKCK